MMIAVFRAATFSLVFLASLAGTVAPSCAADYPNRPVRWLIGFTAGGPVDTVARIMAQWLSERFGQQFVVENRAGSGGNLAAAAAINSPPDGYTLLFVAPNNAISTSLYKKLPYDFIRDTVPDEIIRQLLVERSADGIVGRDEQQRIAIGWRIDRGRGCEIAAGAGAIFHHELLAEALRQPLGHNARHGIDRATGGEADQPAHRPVRIVS